MRLAIALLLLCSCVTDAPTGHSPDVRWPAGMVRDTLPDGGMTDGWHVEGVK